MKSIRLLVAAVCATALSTQLAPANAASLGDLEPVELTHILDAEFPFIPVPGVTFPFGLAPIATIEANGVAANRWIIHEHLGTQIDAPNHFMKGGAGLDALQAGQLVVPLAVIDLRPKVQHDDDARLTIADIQEWEEVHGRIPDRAAVVLYTGWDARIKDAVAYVNADANGVKHYPGIAVEAARWLIEHRNIWGVGVDTLSFDPGDDGGYSTHKALLGAGKFGLEAVANLQNVPAVGATLFIGAPRVRDATGGPVRLIALRPRTPPFDPRSIHGVWESGTPERMDRPDGAAVYVKREFTFSERGWRIVFTVSGDAEGAQRLFTGDFSGAYSIDDYIPLIAANRARFRFSRRMITAHQPQLIRTLQAAGCGEGDWKVGESQDVNEAGCAALRIQPRASCDGEYDIISLGAGGLQLGMRPGVGDLCAEERRPFRLGGPLLRAQVDARSVEQ